MVDGILLDLLKCFVRTGTTEKRHKTRQRHDTNIRFCDESAVVTNQKNWRQTFDLLDHVQEYIDGVLITGSGGAADHKAAGDFVICYTIFSSIGEMMSSSLAAKMITGRSFFRRRVFFFWKGQLESDCI